MGAAIRYFRRAGPVRQVQIGYAGAITFKSELLIERDGSFQVADIDVDVAPGELEHMIRHPAPLFRRLRQLRRFAPAHPFLEDGLAGRVEGGVGLASRP